MRLPRISSLHTPVAFVGVLVLMICTEAGYGAWSAWRHARALVPGMCEVLGARVSQRDEEHAVVQARVRLVLPDGSVADGADEVPDSVTSDLVWAQERARALSQGGPAHIPCYREVGGQGRVELSDVGSVDAARQLLGRAMLVLLGAVFAAWVIRRELREWPYDFVDVTRIPDALYKVDGGKPFRLRMRALGYRGLGFLLQRREKQRYIVAVYACEDGTSVASVDGRGMVFSTLLEDGTVVETWGPKLSRADWLWFGSRPKPHPRAGVHVAQLLERETTLADQVERHARHVREIQKRVGSSPVAHDRVAVLAAIERRKEWVAYVRHQALAWIGMVVMVAWLVGTLIVDLRGIPLARIDSWTWHLAESDAVVWTAVAVTAWYLLGARVLRLLPWPARVPGDTLVRRERARKDVARLAAREAARVLFWETPPKAKKPTNPARSKPTFERSDRERARLCAMFLSFAAALVLCAVAALDSIDQADRALDTEPAAMHVDEARIEKTGSASWGVEVLVRGPIDGVRCAGWQMLPGYETGDALQARTVADSLVGTSMTAYHRPAHLSARLDAHPRFALPLIGLLWGLVGAVVLGRRWAREMVRTDPGARWFEWVHERAKAEASASFKTVPKEFGAKLLIDPKLLYDARNHLPQQPPPGWSVPVASAEGDGAWMIETEEATLIVQLVRDGVSVKLTVIVMPDDMKRPDDFESMELLRHFRKVGEFVEQEPPDELQRDTPWVRFFVADRVEAGDAQDWPRVKVDRQLLN